MLMCLAERAYGVYTLFAVFFLITIYNWILIDGTSLTFKDLTTPIELMMCQFVDFSYIVSWQIYRNHFFAILSSLFALTFPLNFLLITVDETVPAFLLAGCTAGSMFVLIGLYCLEIDGDELEYDNSETDIQEQRLSNHQTTLDLMTADLYTAIQKIRALENTQDLHAELIGKLAIDVRAGFLTTRRVASRNLGGDMVRRERDMVRLQRRLADRMLYDLRRGIDDLQGQDGYLREEENEVIRFYLDGAGY